MNRPTIRETWTAIGPVLVSWAVLASVAHGQSTTKPEAQWYKFSQAGTEFVRRKDYKAAEEAFARALKLCELSDPKGLRLPTTLNSLALVYRFESRYDHAEALYNRSLTIFEAKYGVTSSEVAAVLQNLAICYREQGRFSDAEARFLRALNIFTANLGPDALKTAYVQQELGRLYLRIHKYPQAQELFEKALSSEGRWFGVGSPELSGLRADYAASQKQASRH